MIDSKIESKWQKRWQDAELFHSNPDDREKVFLTVAYPYPSGAMHVGHGRTYTVQMFTHDSNECKVTMYYSPWGGT